VVVVLGGGGEDGLDHSVHDVTPVEVRRVGQNPGKTATVVSPEVLAEIASG
jgi:hypothetical protein